MVSAVLGYGGHGADIAAIYRRLYPTGILAIYDEDPKSFQMPVPDQLPKRTFIGSNYPKTRREIAERLGIAGGDALVDPLAIIGSNVSLGLGVVIAPGAVLLTDVILGNHVHCNYLSSMTRCEIGDYTTVSPSATICGDVTIGSDCIIGAGAVVCDRVVIGNSVRIGAGAIIPPQSLVPSGVTVRGVWKG